MEQLRSDGTGRRSSSFGRYSGWFLAALLILFCSSARSGPFQVHNTSPKPPLRTYIEDPGTRLEAALVLLLLTWWLARLRTRADIVPTPIAISAMVSPVAIAGGFDRRRHIRPPPRF
jgi:hypothetical protein